MAALEPILIGVDLDDTLINLRQARLEKMGAACQEPITLSTADWARGDFPVAKLGGRAIAAGVPLRGDRVTTGNEFFARSAEELGPQPDGRVGLLARDLLTSELYVNGRPIDGAPEAIRQIAQLPGVKVVCVTAHSQEVLDDPVEREAVEKAKTIFIRRNFPEIAEIHFTSDKSHLGLRALIDDFASNQKALLADAPPGFKVLGLLVHTHYDLRAEGAISIASIAEAPQYVEPFVRELMADERRVAAQDMQRAPVAEVDQEASAALRSATIVSRHLETK